MLTTDGTLLGGRVRYRQPKAGFRSGIEPILLAASVPARPGDAVLEAGTGAGAALLCLSARVPGCRVTGVEIDTETAAVAAANVKENGFGEAEIVNTDIVAAGFTNRFHHAMANPPYHPDDAPASDDRTRALAKRGSAALMMDWIGSMAAALRHRGTLTLIVSAPMTTACMTALATAGCPCAALFPLWPRAGVAAKLVVLRGIKGGRTPFSVRPGLVLHATDGSYTDAASAILRQGAPLPL